MRANQDRVIVGALSGLLLCGLAAGCDCSDDGPEPEADAQVPDSGEPPADAGTDATASVFPFLDQEGAAADALTAMYELAQIAPTTRDEANDWLGRKIAARDALAEHREEAQGLLFEALEPLRIEDYDKLVLLSSLLEQIGDSPQILDELHDLAMGPLTGDEQVPAGHDHVSDAELGRTLCMTILGHQARAGSAHARDLALRAAASPAMHVRSAAVQVTLSIAPNRWLAQRALRELLPPENRYLVYQF